MKKRTICPCLTLLSLLAGCSGPSAGEKSPAAGLPTTTYFSTAPLAAFADPYETPCDTKTEVAAVVSRVQYAIFDDTGNNVQERELTDGEIRNGFRVDLPSGRYRMSLLGEGPIVNYTPLGYPPTEIQAAPGWSGVWVAANQAARNPVYHDYYFTSQNFTAGSPGVKPLLLRRATGLVQVEIARQAPGITLNTITLGFPADRMYNNLLTDGNYSCSGQSVENALPYAICHTLRLNPETGYYEGVYLPTLPGHSGGTAIVSYMQGGKVYTRYINLSDLTVKANQRTRQPLAIL